MLFLEIPALLVGGLLALMVGYLLLLTVAACLAPQRTPPSRRPPAHRFLFLIPAHNEERLLPATLTNLQQLDYPRNRYAVHVVADNCTDKTAALARQGGAIVHERFNKELVGKGYALQWLIQRLWDQGEPYDAIVILDADSIVSKQFLTVMDARLAQGERAVQAYYAVRDPELSWSVSLRSVALAALHYLRPQGRMVLGGSAGLKGNGMVFVEEITRRFPWSASLTEDIEYHMALILAGERVTFAPDAVVWAEMPGTLAAAQTQNSRWERGRLDMVRRYVPHLLQHALAQRSFVLFDAAIEQLIPPFSIVAILSVLCLLIGLLLQSSILTLMSAFLIVGQLAYVLGGLLLSGAPRGVYRALLFAPLFVAWKMWLYLRVLAGLDRSGWVRTARNEK